MRSTPLFAGVACVLSLISWAPPVFSQQAGPGHNRVGVLRVEIEGDIPEAAHELLALRLVEGLAAAQFEVFSGATVAGKLEGTAGLASCRDGRCYPAVALALHVAYLVTGKVVGQQKNYEITLELINGRSGGSVGQKRERCELCGIEEAGEKMALAASSLRERLEALAKAPARFIIRSRPAGADALVDGKSAGRTPVDLQLAAGQHSLRLSTNGYDPSERTFVAFSGVDETLDVELIPRPERFPYTPVGWVALAVGSAALIGGVVALAVDGDAISCLPSQKDPRGNCPEVRDTKLLGAVLIGAGAAVGVAGGVSLYLGSLGGVRPAADASASRVPGRPSFSSLGLFARGLF